MKRFLMVAILFSPLPLLLVVDAADFKFPTQTFTVPEGFEIQLVADTNLVQRPVSAAFDDRGRLYVTDSSGSNEKPSEQLKNPTHRVLRLEDTDGDGRFDKSVVFADKVMFPQGCLWHGGSVYVAGPPSIWKFTDTDNDGVADKREEWFKGGTLTGCANDIHGPHLGPDGYLYWTKGAFDEQTHTLGNGRVLKDRAAHIYRARPDGSDLDVIMSGGMDNPVEVAFTAEGEVVFTSTFIDFSQPGFRDGIGHAVYGGVFGKVNSALDDGRVKRTGPDLLHPFVQFGAGAPCGLCRYESPVFGAIYQNNLFATLFNLHKVTRHVLRANGATYASTDSDFVVSDSIDFHPTDVLEDADGSLLIVDTGGWYKLCCPSSQLAKGDVLGGIYRVRKQGGPALANDQRAAAYRQLTSPPSLRERSAEVSAKREAWKADPQSAKHFRELLKKRGPDANNSAESAQLARIAAEGLGRLRDKDSIGALMTVMSDNGIKDPALTHSVIYALIEIADAEGVRHYATSDNIFARRTALIALDQMDGGGLKPEQVTPLLDSSAPTLKQTAQWILGHHPEWGGALASFFRERLAAKDLNDGDRAELQRQLAQFARNAEIEGLLATTARDASAAKSARLTALRAMSQAGLKETPASWLAVLPEALAEKDSNIAGQAVSTARSLSASKGNSSALSAELLNVARNASFPDSIRLDALVAVPGGLSSVDAELFDLLRVSLEPARPVSIRNAASSVLAKAKLNAEQLNMLTETLKTAGPIELPKLLPAFDKSGDEALGLKLLAALKESKGVSALRPDVLKPRLTNFPVVVQQKGDELLATLNTDAEKQNAHLNDLHAQLKGGDVRRGQMVFNGAKAACASCHSIGYLGGNIGPDLTSIGQVRTERDLLEAILYPSVSFVRSYEPMIVATKSGDEYSGVLRKDATDEIVLATGVNTEIRVARADITEMRPGTVSVMPQGLDEQLSRQELADLLAFLKNTRWGPQ